MRKWGEIEILQNKYHNPVWISFQEPSFDIKSDIEWRIQYLTHISSFLFYVYFMQSSSWTKHKHTRRRKISLLYSWCCQVKKTVKSRTLLYGKGLHKLNVKWLCIKLEISLDGTVQQIVVCFSAAPILFCICVCFRVVNGISNVKMHTLLSLPAIVKRCRDEKCSWKMSKKIGMSWLTQHKNIF